MSSRDSQKVAASSFARAYSTRIHEVVSGSYSVTYVGSAPLESQESESVWKIVKIAESGSYLYTYFADGNDYFDNIWSDRVSINYY